MYADKHVDIVVISMLQASATWDGSASHDCGSGKKNCGSHICGGGQGWQMMLCMFSSGCNCTCCTHGLNGLSADKFRHLEHAHCLARGGAHHLPWIQPGVGTHSAGPKCDNLTVHIGLEPHSDAPTTTLHLSHSSMVHDTSCTSIYCQ